MRKNRDELPFQGVVVETYEKHETIGLIFCKDIPNLVKVNLKTTHLNVGRICKFSYKTNRNDELEVDNATPVSAVFDAENNLIKVIFS